MQVTNQSTVSLFRCEEVASLLKVSHATVKRYLAQGRLKRVDLPGRGVRITAESVAALLGDGGTLS